MSAATGRHDHSGKSHLLGMLGIGALVLIVLVIAGRSLREALPIAAALACPLMMVGMLFMMRGADKRQPHTSDPADDAGLGASGPPRDQASSEASPR
jgi:hypothetical protein